MAQASTMLLHPTRVLIATGSLIAASTVALPYVTGYGTVLFQVVTLGASAIVASTAASLFADTHHPVVWSVALVLNLLLFLIPASAVWLAARKRWPLGCSAALLGWYALYVSSLFWLFPATDGP